MFSFKMNFTSKLFHTSLIWLFRRSKKITGVPTYRKLQIKEVCDHFKPETQTSTHWSRDDLISGLLDDSSLKRPSEIKDFNLSQSYVTLFIKAKVRVSSNF